MTKDGRTVQVKTNFSSSTIRLEATPTSGWSSVSIRMAQRCAEDTGHTCYICRCAGRFQPSRRSCLRFAEVLSFEELQERSSRCRGSSAPLQPFPPEGT